MPKISQIFGIPSDIDGYEKIILNQDGGTYTTSLSDVKEYINIDFESLSANLGSAAYENVSAFDSAGSATNTQNDLIGRYANSKMIYVSKALGATDIRTGLNMYDPTRPFASLSAAKFSALSGDTILVMPGTYNGGDLLKNGVNWHFCVGSIVNHSGVGSLFGDDVDSANTPIIAKITGCGVFNHNGTGGSGNHNGVICITNPSSDVYMEALDLTGSQSGAGNGVVVCESGILEVHARNIISTVYDAVLLSGDTFGNGRLYVKAKKIAVTSTADNAIEISGDGTLIVECDEIVSEKLSQKIIVGGTGGYAKITSRKATGGSFTISENVVLNISEIVTSSNESGEESVSFLANSSARIENCKITQTVSGKSALRIASGEVKNCILVAESSATNAVTGTGTIKVFNSFSNKSVAGTVTQQIGTITVDSNIS